MPNPNQRFWVFGSFEFWYLSTIGLIALGFSFTLGVHLGKRSAQATREHESLPEVALAETTKDQAPSRQELAEQMKGVGKVVDDVMNRVLHDEVVRVGLKLDQTRQTDLPGNTKSDVTGNKSVVRSPGAASEAAADAMDEREWAALTRDKPDGDHTLKLLETQQSEKAARLTETLESLGLKPFARVFQPPKAEKRYSVYLGGYHNQDQARSVGNRYKRQHIVEQFNVVEMPSK